MTAAVRYADFIRWTPFGWLTGIRTVSLYSSERSANIQNKTALSGICSIKPSVIGGHVIDQNPYLGPARDGIEDSLRIGGVVLPGESVEARLVVEAVIDPPQVSPYRRGVSTSCRRHSVRRDRESRLAARPHPLPRDLHDREFVP